MVATGFDTAGFETAGPEEACVTAACFSARGFGTAAGFAAGFGEAACFADLAGFDEPWNMFDSQPASLLPTGRSINAATAATIAPRRGQTAKPDAQLAAKLALANFLSDDGNPCFPAE